MAVADIIVLATLAGAPAIDAEKDAVIAEVEARDAEIAAAHGRGDMATYRSGLSDRYAYIDVSGRRVTADMLEARRSADLRRVVSSESSEEEALRLSDTIVLLRGLERSVASYYGGLPRVSASRWSALWVREDDAVWRIVAETSTHVEESNTLPFVMSPQSAATLQALAGRWTLSLQPRMDLLLAVEGDHLIGSLVGQSVRWTFRPASASHFIAEERPFELRFAPDGKSMQLVTWGTATAAVRAAK